MKMMSRDGREPRKGLWRGKMKNFRVSERVHPIFFFLFFAFSTKKKNKRSASRREHESGLNTHQRERAVV
jgi:hypothetical protein